jgi:DNA mismatch repair protein MutL
VGNIIVLPEEVYTKIAAGEVVDGPSAVVRELIDNALDAGAGSIRITINNGGKDFIQVTDNGCGMTAEDALLSIKKHTTSKIRRFEDLSEIVSMGFRGEALSSISAVADFSMVTRTKDGVTGTRMSCPAGGECTVEPAASNTGTTVTVRDLFRNVPARRKFLKSNRAEAAKIGEEVRKKALGFFDRAFQFTSDDRALFNLHPADTIQKRIGQIFGETLARTLIECNGEDDDFRIRGFVSNSMTLPNRRGQYFFINRRPVVHPSLFFAVNAPFRGKVPSGRYVYAFILIEMNPSLIDVNVHPAKKEVRIKTLDSLFSSLRTSIDTTHFFGTGFPSEADVMSHENGKTDRPGMKEKFYTEGSGDMFKVAQPHVDFNMPSNHHETGKKAPYGYTTGRASEVTQAIDSLFSPLTGLEAQSLVEIKNGADAGLVFFRGCLFMTYLLFELDDRFVVLDQHAAHERVLYEKFYTESAREVAVKNLLVPINITPPASQYGALIEHIDSFNAAGIELEPFGDESLNICSLPAYIPDSREEELLSLFLEDFYRGGIQPDEAHIREYFIKIAACRAAVKEGDRLNEDEAIALLKELLNAHVPFICPHGRPAILYTSKSGLDKLFGRI